MHAAARVWFFIFSMYAQTELAGCVQLQLLYMLKSSVSRTACWLLFKYPTYVVASCLVAIIFYQQSATGPLNALILLLWVFDVQE
jgi:hypothetical protein